VPIPRLLHCIWIGPHDPPMELIDSWSDKHVNGWLFTLWRDHKTGWKNQAAINRMREWNGKADIMRLEILEQHGGVCVDADSLCVKALDEGPEAFLENDGAFLFNENESCRPGIVGCGIMGAPAHSPFFAECVRRVAERDMSKPAWTTVGPLLVTEVAAALPEAVRVYPARHAHPVHYTGTPAPGEGTVYAEQRWGGTKGYNQLRRRPCWCDECRVNMLRPPWG
jgi:mannosyltransferase OCH1-like enzyme